MDSNRPPEHVAFFSPYTEHVGTERAMVNIARHFANNGISVDLLRLYSEWPETASPPGAVVELDSKLSTALIDRLPRLSKRVSLALYSLTQLARYLRRNSPDVLIVGLLSAMGVYARELAGVDTELVISLQGLPRRDRVRSYLWPRTYPRADALVAPSTGVGQRARELIGADALGHDITVIPNPVITDEILDQGASKPDHPWFQRDEPVIVGVGRQTWQKDFKTLIRAFFELREQLEAKLIVPGKEGEQTSALRELSSELGVDDDVDFPGFVENVYAYMSEADVFVLSSRFEGPGHVLIEALALGTPVVSTDCPAGPREILRNGAAGELVPTESPSAMCTAIAKLLSDPDLRAEYRAAGIEAVEPYWWTNGAEQYLELCRSLLRESGRSVPGGQFAGGV